MTPTPNKPSAPAAKAANAEYLIETKNVQTVRSLLGMMAGFFQ